MLTARITTEVDSDWHPHLSLDPSYKWTEPPNFRVLGIDITIADKVDPSLREAMEKFKATLLEQVKELDVRKPAEELWKKAYEPLEVLRGPDVWARFTPKAVGFSGISSDANKARRKPLLDQSRQCLLSNRYLLCKTSSRLMGFSFTCPSTPTTLRPNRFSQNF